MTMTYEERRSSDQRLYRERRVWTIATLLLAGTTILFGFLYWQERQRQPVGAAVMQKEHSAHHMVQNDASRPYDLMFIDMMIPHHEGAIDEARQALQQAEHPELKDMARNIIRSQRDEIEHII
jgi:uncharacterized protein (DUF305 family)